jgi:hypothetical protein
MENITNPIINNTDVKREKFKTKVNPQIRYTKDNIKNTNIITDNLKLFMLPYTNIIKYIISGFDSYNIIKQQREKNGEFAIKFDDIFELDSNNLILNKLNVDLTTSINQKQNFSLDKLLAYSIYTTTPYWFDKDYTFFLKEFTNQLGKDLRRSDYIINNDTKYTRSFFQTLMVSNKNKIISQNDSKLLNKQNFKQVTETDYSIISNYYFNTIKNLGKNTNIKNFNNIANKICLLSIQNINNFIFTNLLGPWVSSLISPEQAFITQTNVLPSNIVIQKNKITYDIHFTCGLLFTTDMIPDPEIPFGKVDAILSIDLLSNTYKFTTFNIKYNLEKTDINVNNQILNGNQSVTMQNKLSDKFKKINIPNDKLIYGASALGLSGAIVALPFILGGKKNRKTRKFKKKRSNKTYKK